MKKNRGLWGVLLFVCCFSASMKAELGTTHWWGSYTFNQRLNEQWGLSAKIGCRYYNFETNEYRPDFSPQVQFAPGGHLKYQLGTRFFSWNTARYDGVMEYRPWLGLAYTHTKSGSLSLSHLARWEHRFWGAEDLDYSTRLRYRFKLGTALYEHGDKQWQIALAPEMFWVFGAYDEATYTATRWGIPLSYRYNKHFLFELAPFLQTKHEGISTLLDDQFCVIQFNLKTFL